MGLKEDLAIDKFSLDTEALKQPMLYEKYGKELVDAEMDRDYAKEKVELVKAEMDLKIRKNPKAFGLDAKPKETEIKSAISIQPEVQEAIKEHLECIRDAKNLAVVVKRIDTHRKNSLKQLNDQDARGYFIRPENTNINQSVKKEIEQEKAKEVKQEQKKQITRTRRVRREE